MEKCNFCGSKIECCGFQVGAGSRKNYACKKCGKATLEIYYARRGLQFTFDLSKEKKIIDYINDKWSPHVNAYKAKSDRHESEECKALLKRVGKNDFEAEYKKLESSYGYLDGAVIPRPKCLEDYNPPTGFESLIDDGILINAYEPKTRTWVKVTKCCSPLEHPAKQEELDRAARIGKILHARPKKIQNDYDALSPYPWISYKIANKEFIYGKRSSVWEIRSAIGSKAVEQLANSRNSTVSKDGFSVHAWTEKELFEYFSLYAIEIQCADES